MQDEGFEPFPLYPVLLDMKGDTLDVDTAASSDMYLGTLKEPPPGSPKTSKPRPRLPGVKVGVEVPNCMGGKSNGTQGLDASSLGCSIAPPDPPKTVEQEWSVEDVVNGAGRRVLEKHP